MINAYNLRCKYRINPLGIDVIQPRLSWVLQSDERGQKQSAYQVLVASNRDRRNVDDGDIWDSGKVESDQTAHIQYAGSSLVSRMRCYWKVRVWDRHGNSSSWSEPAIWSMGLLKESDWQGDWIGELCQPENAAIMLRKELKLQKQVVRATAYICGLGYYELYVNGRKIGDHVLDPGWTDYAKRVLYVTYDVTNYFKQGSSVIGVILGNGWYNLPTPDTWGFHKAPYIAPPKLLLRKEKWIRMIQIVRKEG